MTQAFKELISKIEKTAQKNLNTGWFDKLLLEGGRVQNIYDEMKKRGYQRKGWFISDRTFWGHIGVRIRDENFRILINENDFLSLSSTNEQLDKLFIENVYIKLIGCGDDIAADDLYVHVKKSMLDPAEARKKRLDLAAKMPLKIESKSSSFIRNPDVIAEVLLRANGICELCNNPAPFKRKSDNSPYLEVHHKVFLSNDGEDTVENAMALCPNCHRFKHFG